MATQISRRSQFHVGGEALQVEVLPGGAGALGTSAQRAEGAPMPPLFGGVVGSIEDRVDYRRQRILRHCVSLYLHDALPRPRVNVPEASGGCEFARPRERDRWRTDPERPSLGRPVPGRLLLRTRQLVGG